MNSEGDSIRSLIMQILLRGNPQEIADAGLVGADADAEMTDAQIAAAERAGLKSPGRPMTVTQIAQAVLAGILPPRTQIVHSEDYGY